MLGALRLLPKPRPNSEDATQDLLPAGVLAQAAPYLRGHDPRPTPRIFEHPALTYNQPLYHHQHYLSALKTTHCHGTALPAHPTPHPPAETSERPTSCCAMLLRGACDPPFPWWRAIGAGPAGRLWQKAGLPSGCADCKYATTQPKCARLRTPHC